MTESENHKSAWSWFSKKWLVKIRKCDRNVDDHDQNVNDIFKIVILKSEQKSRLIRKKRTLILKTKILYFYNSTPLFMFSIKSSTFWPLRQKSPKTSILFQMPSQTTLDSQIIDFLYKKYVPPSSASPTKAHKLVNVAPYPLVLRTLALFRTSSKQSYHFIYHRKLALVYQIYAPLKNRSLTLTPLLKSSLFLINTIKTPQNTSTYSNLLKNTLYNHSLT